MNIGSVPVVAAVGVALVATGCAPVHRDAVAQVTTAFYQAVANQDGARACALLSAKTRAQLVQSEKKPCPRAILSENVRGPGAIRHTDVYGTAAQVRLSHDTAFLDRFQDGWKVIAAGCRPRPAKPYDCQVSGG